MRDSGALLLLATLLAAGCGGDASSDQPAPAADTTAAATPPAGGGPTATGPGPGASAAAIAADSAPPVRIAGADSALLVRGQQVFQSVCYACHSYNPPAKLAPPMTEVGDFYRRAFTDRDAALAYMVDYARQPAAEKSKLPPMAIQRFGVMPPQGLPEEDLRAAAAYAWELGAFPPAAHGMGMGGGRGQGAGRGARP